MCCHNKANVSKFMRQQRPCSAQWPHSSVWLALRACCARPCCLEQGICNHAHRVNHSAWSTLRVNACRAGTPATSVFWKPGAQTAHQNGIHMKHIASSKLHASYQQLSCQRLCKPGSVLVIPSLLRHMCLKHSACTSTCTCTCEQMPQLDISMSTLDLPYDLLHSLWASLLYLDACRSWPGCSLTALLLEKDASLCVAQQQQSLQNPREQPQLDNVPILRKIVLAEASHVS